MKRLAFFNFLIFTFFISACTGDEALIPMLERAEAYLPECPDSAECVLDSMPSTPSRGEALALYGLVRTMTDAMQGKGVTTDSLIRPAYIYYNKESSSPADIRRLGRSAFYLAQFEASRDSTKRAEDLYREAIKYSEEVEDWRTCYMAYSWFARIKTWSDKKEAIRLLNTAIDIYHKVEDKPANLVSVLLDLSINHLALPNHNDSAFFYANHAYSLSCDLKLEMEQYASLFRLSDCYYYIHDYPKALELAKQGMHGLTDQTRDAALFSLADCYLACDSLDQAKSILMSISSSDNKMRYSVFRKLSRIAMLQNDLQSSLTYSDSLDRATVDMFSSIQHTKEEYYNDNIQKELNNERLALTSLRQKMIIIISFLVLALVITVFTVLFWFNKQKHRLQRYADIQRTRNYISIQNAKQREQRFQIETNKQLVHQKSLTSALLQKHFLRHLADLKTDLENSEKVKMDQLIWEEIEDTLNATDNGFVRTLRKGHPDFDEEDIHLCMLVRMKVPNSIMSKIFHIGIDAVKKRRKTMKRNGFNCHDKDKTLDEIIEKIC